MTMQRYVECLGSPHRLLEALEAASTSGFSEFTAADFLKRLMLVLHDKSYRALFFGHISAEDLGKLLKQPPASNSAFEMLQSTRLLPTPRILSFALTAGRNGADAILGLEKVVEDINGGCFDLSDQLHLELEYSRYVARYVEMSDPLPLGEPVPFRYKNMPFEAFAGLPFLDGQKAVLSDFEYSEAERTAEEALNVLNFIRSKVSQPPQVPLLVIGNMRYGSFFVVKPIEDYLIRTGVKVVHEYVSSRDFDRTNRGAADISEGTLEWIAANSPNIVVVDGTANNWVHDKNLNFIEDAIRFPAAMLGYINVFAKWNSELELPEQRYRLSFWSPKMHNRVFVGDHYECRQRLATDGCRELTIVCSTSHSSGSSGGYFDDPENLAKRPVLGFASRGLQWRVAAAFTDDFVMAVQDYMKARIAEQLRQ